MKKKHIISLVLAAVLLISVLAACSGDKLSGTYRSTGLFAQTFTFDTGNRVTMSAFGVNASGTYRISGGRMTVTYTIFGMDTNWTCNIEQRGKSIFIDGTEFVKR